MCSIINAFRTPYVQDFSEDKDIARIMLERKAKVNVLQQQLENKSFLKRQNWQKVEAESTALDFPILSIEDIKGITMGIFHIKQAFSYAQEHIDDDGQYEVLMSTQFKGLLLAYIQSKHSNRKQYNALIKYDSTSVQEWCCQCPNGNNTIGCCSHICSIIWYLGLARHDHHQPKQVSNLFMNYLKDASVMSSSEDENDDDNVVYELAD